MLLAPDRVARFARHIVLPEIGGAGQVALANAAVALVGCGGIGAPALQYLAAAGVGRLRLIDDDAVEPANLQRQTIFTAAEVGQPKAMAAAGWVARFDPALVVEARAERLGAANSARLLAGADVVIDGTDNFATRLAVSDFCVAARTPLVSAAVGRFQGQVGAFAGHRRDAACYRCFVGDAFDADDCDSCAADGVLGAFVGVVGALGAMAAIRVILAAGGIAGPLADPQWGRLHVIDGLAPALRSLTIAKDPACRGCGG